MLFVGTAERGERGSEVLLRFLVGGRHRVADRFTCSLDIRVRGVLRAHGVDVNRLFCGIPGDRIPNVRVQFLSYYEY